MTIKEIRKQTGMSQREFAEYFGIPVRTIQEWEQERRQPPPYLSELLERILDSEKRRRKLKEVPQDRIFNTEGGGRERCHATGYEMFFSGHWWQEYEGSKGDLHYWGE